MRSALVLGAGMAGVSAALQLQARGWSVALVDRREPGRETSYGNAGIIQSEAVEPYPMPRTWPELLAVALGRTNDVHYALRDLPAHLGPLLRYWWHSAPARHRRIATAYASAISHATAEHESLFEPAGAAHLVRRDGFRILHRSPATMQLGLAKARRLLAEYGVAFRVLSPSELGRAEPALTERGVGAIHWLDSWTVSDPGALVSAYAGLFVRRGGRVVEGDAGSLARSGAGWRVAAADGPIDAEAAVLALGPWSAELLRGFGYRFPMVRKRGYHTHYRTEPSLDLPLMDVANGYMMAPMAKGLRITTGAEFLREGAASAAIQLRRAEEAAGELLRLGARVENQPWSGIRPCMADMLPVIGEAPRHPGLWLHFGHGHQGFTLGPATGRLLAELMGGDQPFIDPAPFRPGRF